MELEGYFIENCNTEFKKITDDLDSLINFKISSLNIKGKYHLNVKDEFGDLENRVNEFDKNENDTNYLKLKNIKKCIEKLISLQSLKKETSSLASKHDLSIKIQKEFNETKETYINNLIEEIEVDVDRFYDYLHKGEDISSIDMTLNGTSRLRFYINSFGQKADPRSFSSEGHLDSLGICVFLVLMKRNHINSIAL